MKNITLYTTPNCAYCSLVERILETKNIPFKISTNLDSVIGRGFTQAPVLQVDDEFLNRQAAIRWAGSQDGCA